MSRGRFIITYRIMKILVTTFDKQEAFKYYYDKKGKVLRKLELFDCKKKSYTILHRFIFNLKDLQRQV